MTLEEFFNQTMLFYVGGDNGDKFILPPVRPWLKLNSGLGMSIQGNGRTLWSEPREAHNDFPRSFEIGNIGKPIGEKFEPITPEGWDEDISFYQYVKRSTVESLIHENKGIDGKYMITKIKEWKIYYLERDYKEWDEECESVARNTNIIF